MRVFNKEKTIELKEYDTTKGRLIPDTLTVRVEAKEYIPEKFHYKTVKVYPNGGKDVERVIDVPGVEEVLEHDETEDIFVYVPYTDDELELYETKRKVAALKAELYKVKEDIEQEGYGIIRDDYADKKARAAEIINELRSIEGKTPRQIA